MADVSGERVRGKPRLGRMVVWLDGSCEGGFAYQMVGGLCSLGDDNRRRIGRSGEYSDAYVM